MTKAIITLLVLFPMCIITHAQVLTKTKIDNGRTGYYTTKDGQLHGEYKSLYDNGNTKAEGKFYHNNRVGTWSILDSTGNKILEREYQNNFVYERTLPEFSKQENKLLFHKCLEVPVRLEDKTLEYYHLEEDNILYAVRNLNIILPENNPLLFKNNKILKLFINNQEIEGFEVYDIFGKYDKSTFEIESSDNLEVIAYKIHREFVLDKDRKIIETREIFISPVIQNINTKEIYPNNWFYFPNIRSELAKIEVSIPDCKLNIENISDLFFWLYNTEIIIKENKDFLENTKDIDNSIFTDKEKLDVHINNNNQKLLNRIEIEHKLWIKFIEE